jgi:DNA invertase Pin-like site-specific DNA recombinase
MHAIGYIRVSTDEQALEGVSLKAQADKLHQWARLNDATIEIYSDAGISGTKRNREGLNKAIDALQPNSALVVYALSRLSRSTKDTLELSELLQRKQADLVSLSERIDTTTASGKMVFRLLAVLNEFERDQISERTKTALSYKKAKGQRVGTLPFGYDIDTDGQTLVVNNYEQGIISKVRAYHRKGLSLRKIANRLAEAKLFSRRSNKPLSHKQVYRILQATA